MLKSFSALPALALALAFALVLCACSMPAQTRDPAVAYAATEIYRLKDGTLQVSGDSSPAYMSTTIEVPTAVLCGLQARVKQGRAAYACYLLIGKYDNEASSMAESPDDIVKSHRELPYTRAALDAAANGAGLTVPLPQWHTQQSFSAAYVRGFLQKVDETIRNPGAAKIVK